MNCVIPGQNLRILGKAIHALSKIGDEIHFEANSEYLLLKTVNIATTVFAIAKFNTSFFTHYNVSTPETETNTESTQTAISCQISARSLFSTFKNPNQLEKQVEVCKIELDNSPTRIVIKFRCKHNIEKTDTLWLNDSDEILNIETLTKSNDITYKLISSSVLYAQTLANFQLTDTEICFDISRERISIRNYVEGEPLIKNHVRSTLSLDPVEFQNYESGGERNVLTFSLKSFRAAIHFAEYFNLGVTFRFQKAGRPVEVQITNNTTFELSFILATMHPDENSQSTIVSGTENINRNVAPEFETETERFIGAEAANEMEVDKEDTMIPTTPPQSPRTKRIRHLFQRCFEPTFSYPPDEEILAPNSDDE